MFTGSLSVRPDAVLHPSGLGVDPRRSTDAFILSRDRTPFWRPG